MAFSSSSFSAYAVSLTIFSTLLFFFLNSPHPPPNPSSLPRRSLLNATIDTNPHSCSQIYQTPPQNRCDFSLHCVGDDTNGLFNYFSLHFCAFGENPFLTIPSLALLIVFHFYVLVKTAQDRFSEVVTKLAAHLRLSPSMAAVTLLALGNGAPDVFASVAAVRGGHPRTGFGAILSAGAFVSAFVVGFVAIHAAPFAVNPAPFVRDVSIYLLAALFLFSVYLSAEIFLWQAIGFVGFYAIFVGFVFYMDLGMEDQGGKRKGGHEVGSSGDGEAQKSLMGALDCEAGEMVRNVEEESKLGSGLWGALGMVCIR